MRHVQALLNWILLSTGRTDLKRLVVVVVVGLSCHIILAGAIYRRDISA